MMKGSIEVTIGFLIVMVIAALTMIFVMGWMGQLFPTLQDIGTFATDKAKTQMMEEFGKGAATILATVPDNKEFPPGSNVKFIIGVKKQAGVDESNYFNLCVAKTGSTGCESDTGGTPVPAADDDSGVLFSFQPTIPLVKRGDTDTVTATMQIGGEVEPDTYGFVIYACAKTTVTDECTGIEDAEYYGMYDFQITVK
jgi:hypothetical protein